MQPIRVTPEFLATLTNDKKENMINNFRIELEERKEKLRQLYNAQAITLDSRIARRAARIPKNLRKTKLIDLMAFQTEHAKSRLEPKEKAAYDAFYANGGAKMLEHCARNPPPPEETAPRRARLLVAAAKALPAKEAAAAAARGKKRTSAEMAASDKENMAEALQVKRTRAPRAPPAAPAAPTRATRATRATSRKEPEILSPKPNNPRTTTQTRSRRVR